MVVVEVVGLLLGVIGLRCKRRSFSFCGEAGRTTEFFFCGQGRRMLSAKRTAMGEGSFENTHEKILWHNEKQDSHKFTNND